MLECHSDKSVWRKTVAARSARQTSQAQTALVQVVGCQTRRRNSFGVLRRCAEFRPASLGSKSSVSESRKRCCSALRSRSAQEGADVANSLAQEAQQHRLGLSAALRLVGRPERTHMTDTNAMTAWKAEIGWKDCFTCDLEDFNLSHGETI
jgi:hypothetical protein